MRLLSYLSSILSPKKLTYKHISFFTLWDNRTDFTPFTHVLSGAKLSNVIIGKYSRVGVNCQVTNANIGNFTAIGKDSVIGLGQHPTNYLTSHSIFYKKGNWGWHDDWIAPIDFVEEKRIHIGNDVWIGRHCMIMDGVTIGDGAVIGAGAVVTKDVPPYAVVAGVPAKVLKYRFDEDTIRDLLEIRWWDMPESEITKYSECIMNVNKFVKQVKACRGGVNNVFSIDCARHLMAA